MSRSSNRSILFVVIAAIVSCAIVAHAAVIGIDFGSEFIKVALVKPGTPFHIVIDEQSMRKVPHCIGFDDTQRVFGNGATSLAVRKPKHTYLFANTLLGRSIDSAQVKAFKDYNYPYEIVAVPERNTVAFTHAGGENGPTSLTPEELVAMSLQHIKQICEVDAGGEVKDAVITVPEFWTQKERQALLDAAEVAGLNVLSLLNENTAAAIQYGIDFKFVANETHRALFYNMGSTSTKVSLVEYSSYPERGKKNSSIGQFEVLSVAYDETLGGQAFEVRLMDWMIQEANKMFAAKGPKFATDVRTNQRALAKLRVAAVKAKTVLSANKDTPIFVSSLANDVDFKTMLSRDKFIELSADLIDRAVTPVKRVLEERKLAPSDVDSVLIIGGGVRIPSIQKAIKDYLKREDLGQSLDGDEAMAMGAVFRAANLSTSFKTRKLGMIDVTPFPVGVRLANLPKEGVVESVAVQDDEEPAPAAADDADDEKEGDEAAAAATETPAAVAEDAKKAGKPFSKRAALFRRYNRLAKKKTVAFSHTNDLVCTMHHDSPKVLPSGVVPAIGYFNITGVEAIIKDKANEKLLETQKPKVALSFQLDGSGLVDLVKAEATLEEMVKVPLPKKVNKTAEAGKTETKPAAAEGSDATTATGEEATTGDAEKKAEAPATEEPAAATPSAATEEGAAGKTEESAKEEPQFTMRKKVHRFNLAVTHGGAATAPRPYDRDDVKASRAKLAKMQKQDEFQRDIAQSKNNVESHVYNTRQALEKEEWIEVSTEAQRTAVLEALEAAEGWLYEQSDESPKPFKDKLAELKALSDPIGFRASEVIARAEALNHTASLLEYTRDLLKRFETERPWLPKEDVEALKKLVDEVEEWANKKVAEQATKQLSEAPAFTSDQLLDKLKPIARNAKQLLDRKKPAEPKPKVPKTAKKNATAADNETTTEEPASTESTSGDDTNTDSTADANTEKPSGKPKDDL